MKSKLSILLLFACMQTIQAQTDNSLALVAADGSRISLPTTDFAPPWTVETWIIKEDFSGTTSHLASSSSGGVTGIRLEQYDSTNEVGITEGGVEDYSFGYIMTNQVWQHMAVVCNGTNTVLYINGEQAGSTINATINAPMGFLGHDDTDFSTTSNVDEYRVWNKALTSAQIKTMMGQEIQQNGTAVQGAEDATNVSGLNWSDLQLYFKFNETSGTSPVDSSSNGNDGTGVNVTASNWESSDSPYVWDGSSSSSWATLANWQDRGRGTVPGSSDNIVIDGDATNDLTITDARSANNMVISDGAIVNLDPAASLTLTGAAEINGASALIINSDATQTANFIDNGLSYKNSGSVKVERYMEAYNSAVNLQGYHYISSPVNNHAKFNDMSDLYSYNESTLNWVHHSSFTNFTNAVGYAIRYTSNITKEFTGDLNTGDQTISITYNDDLGSSFDHFNLIGNPYPSSISADDIVDNNSSIIEASVYFWNGIDYGTYNTTLNAGTAGSRGGAPDGQIAVGQGFFVDAKSGGGTITMTNAMRGTDSNIFYKKESYPYVRVLLSGEEGKSELLLTGHSASSNGFDNYDSKQLPGSGSLSLTSLIDETAYVIESVPQIENNIFNLQVTSTTDQKVTFDLLDAVDIYGMNVYLEDSEHHTVVDISNEAYTTFVSEGAHNNRFKLRIGAEELDFSAWVNNSGLINFIGQTDEQVIRARLVSLDGKTIATASQMQFGNWEALANGVYLLEIQTNMQTVVQKIIR